MPQDFSGKNLQGRSFKGQDLTGANFSYAYIRDANFTNVNLRGANFTNAILRGANFSHAKAGLQRRSVIGLVLVSWLMSAMSGIFSGYAGYFVSFVSEIGFYNFYTGLTWLIVLTIFWIITIRQGLLAGLGAIALASTGAIAIAIAIASTGSIAIAIASTGNIVIAITSTGAIAITGVLASAVAVALALACASAIAVAVTIALASAVATAVAATSASTSAAVVAIALAEAFSLLSAYVGWRALEGDPKHAWIRSFAIAFASTGGTNFHSADLTDADFTQATLKNTDLSKANLTRTRFYESKKLDFARVDDTILVDTNVVTLLVSGNGRGQSYVGANLRGANLMGANLKDANLKQADIIAATFQGACLESANLTLTQAIDTDFTSAQMTGACVEAWNIESTTKLDDVDCRYVYLLEYPKPKTDDRERRPSSGEFKAGEFTKLFEEVLNTVDLIFRDGVDWKAFLAAFQKVQVENEDSELAIQSIENKGDGVVVVKVSVPPDANKEKIHSDFNQNYSLALQAVEAKYKALLQAKDEQIEEHRQKYTDMKEITSLLASKSINVQVESKLENKNMTNSNDSSRKVEIGSVGRDFNASGQALNLGEIDISGTVTNAINELPPATQADKPGIKELLKQLQTAIEEDDNLTAKNKEKALKQVKALAEASQNPQQEEKQDLAGDAITMLKGLVTGLPGAAKLVEDVNNLLPLISGCLGLG
ncbi:pentapeptide repeat-containing protein [Calothrix sp. PCC 6303]|uniref:pentapeptide repeat-containing protein n=1 Tax=Calothrix sp. PCC 6303 TaxID=1170562 RepID=UPI0002A056E1|nr:pentapeptide repeat-containing protein [Calothrix sp. PCC 6303]AFZ04226.1 pentapeptide repeat protein [Calothrix sp. PCC 6303]